MRWVFAALLVAGCANTVQQSNSAGGVIAMNFNVGQSGALKQAEAECQKYGKVAVSKGVNEVRNSLRYECVAP